MADKKISELTNITGANLADADEFVVVDTSASETKAITYGELKKFTGDVTVSGAITATGGDLDLATLDLSAIDTSIADTAVDVFVYDTSKDSDGGAWRKRTQHTSWYNETLNTATRGSRREFPAVAVIVAEANQVTIYDGDDPDLPMWMVFNAGGAAWGSNNHIGPSNIPVTSVSCLNGQMVSGSNGVGVFFQNFIVDGTTGRGTGAFSNLKGAISQRNATLGLGAEINTTSVIVNDNINDVAMTVLPNAPIDAATGLPVPTIAVATDGGVSVIKDDGTVVDSSNTGTYGTVDFYGDNFLVARNTSAGGIWTFHDYSSDSFVTFKQYTQTNTAPYIGAGTSGAVGTKGNNFVKFRDASNGVQTMVAENVSAGNKGMAHFFTSSYATGWMNGDIKLATLSDTDATNVTGSELVTNGTFDTDTSGWTASTGATVTHDTNRMKVAQGTSNDYVVAYQAIATVIGETYTASFDVIDDGSSTSSAALYIRTQPTGGNIVIGGSGFGTNSVTFTATTTTTYIAAGLGTSTDNVYVLFDNISVRLAEEDRSVNGNGLQVFGTVTKAPVATGAELVAYSGFSASNYLEQPYNSGLDFGTGDFCIMGWVKTPDTGSSNLSILRRQGNTGLGQFRLRSKAGKASIWVSDDYAVTIDEALSTTDIDNNVWHFITVVKNGTSTLQMYVNGQLEDTSTITAATGSLSSSDATTRLGVNQVGNEPWIGSLALFRISATAPTAEQISRIYNDEKHLFTEGAACTIAGTSDAVTALAFDDSTNLLHVGSSYGRSVFQGLRRVSNTTTAVGTAISASNGLVVEE